MKQHRAEPIQRVYVVVGSLLSVAAGLLLALFAFGIVLIFAGSPTEGGYCSESGIGQYEVKSAWEKVVYLDEGWSGLPPGQHCRVYLASATGDNLPQHLMAEGTYPGTQEYAWIAGALLLPLAIWCLLLAIAKFAGRHGRPEG